MGRATMLHLRYSHVAARSARVPAKPPTWFPGREQRCENGQQVIGNVDEKVFAGAIFPVSLLRTVDAAME